MRQRAGDGVPNPDGQKGIQTTESQPVTRRDPGNETVQTIDGGRRFGAPRCHRPREIGHRCSLVRVRLGWTRRQGLGRRVDCKITAKTTYGPVALMIRPLPGSVPCAPMTASGSSSVRYVVPVRPHGWWRVRLPEVITTMSCFGGARPCRRGPPSMPDPLIHCWGQAGVILAASSLSPLPETDPLGSLMCLIPPQAGKTMHQRQRTFDVVCADCHSVRYSRRCRGVAGSTVSV